MRSSSSRAARFPTSGLPPAPRPRVSFSPSWSLTGERLVRSAWASVLAARKSTPGSPAAIMVFTALLPPPPTPITLIRAPSTTSTTSPIAPPPSGVRPRADASHSEELPQPAHHPVPRPLERAEPRPILLRRRASVPLESVQHEADSCRIHWTRDDVNQSTEMKRQTEARRSAEDALRERSHAAEDRAAAGQHDAGGEMPGHARALDPAPHHRQHLLAARLDHLGEPPLRPLVWRPPADAGDLDGQVRRGRERQRRAAALLQALGFGERGAQRGGEVVGDVPPADREHRRVPDGTGMV